VLAVSVTTSGDAQKSIPLLAALLAAIACLSVAATPAATIPWQRGALFVVYRRSAVMTLGILCLVAAAALLLRTR
jgi:hypothetical protein